MALYEINETQLLYSDIDTIWDFISSYKNLQEITPKYMNFQIVSQDLPEKIYPGMMIQYKVSPVANVPMTWLTEITQVKEGQYFVDEQRVGPYKIWHHEHWLSSHEKGVLMQDKITYQLPFGILGDIANAVMVKKQLVDIFKYRTEVLDKKYNTKAFKKD